ncbi:MAG: ribonuclease J [Lachnospiraceae bacterium]|nr:ribonuclease J [Lachnospiraceae bacterium]
MEIPEAFAERPIRRWNTILTCGKVEEIFLKKNEQGTASGLKIIPLGGLEQIGLNITAFEYEDSIIVVDCGLSFPEDEMLGIDLVIPDVTYLKDNIDKVKGFMITHGHEDHIGALPYILKEINVPVYATKLTMGIIENKLREHELMNTTKRKVVKFGQSINLGQFRIEFIKTNHSIVDAAALAIYSPAGIVVHTGDFKVDYTPVFGDAIDLQRFAEIGKKGVLALMCDSTNAERPGFTPSEKTVGKTFDTLFSEHSDTRIIIATFASNVDRVQQIINSAYKFGRKVVVEGRSMVNIIETASTLGYLNIPDQTLIDVEQLKNYPNEKTVIITTGSQGESMAALSRMAGSIHKKISIVPGDTVIFSSNPIPGNEKAVTNVINELLMKGADVIFQDVHVSGHACQEEIKLLYTLLHPKYAVPVHGEYKHLKAQAKIAKELGIDKEDIFILHSGDVLEISDEKAEVTGRVPVGAILVDGLGVGDVGNVVLRDRQHLAEDGIIIVVLALDSYNSQLVSGPDIVSRGFVYVRESDELLEEARLLVDGAVEGCLEKGQTDWGKLKSTIKDVLSEYVWKKTKRRPMILPIIMEV